MPKNLLALPIPPPPPGDDEPLHELVDGKWVAMPYLSALCTRAASRIAYELARFVQARDLGQIVAFTLFRLALARDINRRPAAAFVSYHRWPKNQPMCWVAPAWDVIPDLVVEVVGPDFPAEELLQRIQEYAGSGVRLVWVVYPRLHLAEAYESLTKAYESLTKVRVFADELDGGTVLPGFHLSLKSLFPPEAPAS